MELVYVDDDILVCLKPARVLSTDEPGGVPDLCREVLEDIFAGGNFGRKDTTRAASAHMVSDSGKSGTKRSKLGNLLMILYRAVRERHPL